MKFPVTVNMWVGDGRRLIFVKVSDIIFVIRKINMNGSLVLECSYCLFEYGIVFADGRWRRMVMFDRNIVMLM